MLTRRRILQLFPFAILSSAPTAGAAPGQRVYRGRLRYSLEGRENGREEFSVVVQADGMRTLRAHCEMDDDRLLRDVTITLDGTWRPLTAFIQLTLAGKLTGATWFRFAENEALAEGYSTNDGRISQRFALKKPATAFGTHPIHGDAWNLAQLRLAGGQPVSNARFTSSSLSNGGSGPKLVLLPEKYLVYSLVGRETIAAPAGRYDAEHFTMTVTGKKKINHIWAYGQDCIPILMTTPEGRRYELTELSGDPR